MPPTKQLFVLRHAKSSWDDPGLDDHERPLAPRGQRSVRLLAAYLRTHNVKPEQVLCSSARRTIETCEGVDPGGELIVEPELYNASGDQVLARLRRVPETASSVMVIGHNPALQMLVLRLIGANGGHARSPEPLDDDSMTASLQRKFPTGTMATLSFDGAWEDLSPGQAELVDLIRPRDLH